MRWAVRALCEVARRVRRGPTGTFRTALLRPVLYYVRRLGRCGVWLGLVPCGVSGYVRSCPVLSRAQRVHATHTHSSLHNLGLKAGAAGRLAPTNRQTNYCKQAPSESPGRQAFKNMHQHTHQHQHQLHPSSDPDHGRTRRSSNGPPRRRFASIRGPYPRHHECHHPLRRCCSPQLRCCYRHCHPHPSWSHCRNC